MTNFENVVKKINYFQTNELKKDEPENGLIYAPLNYKEHNYGFMIFSEEKYESKIERLKDCQYRNRYYYYEKFKNEGKNIIFIMFNPSSACPNSDDPTIRNCRKLVEDKYGSMEIINIFSQRNPNVKKIAKDKNKENLEFIEEFLKNRKGTEVVIAWGYGKEKDYIEKVGEVKKLLNDFTKLKITIKKEALEEIQNYGRHPAPPAWSIFNGFENAAQLVKY